MKVLIVSPKFHPVIGGGETFVLNSAKKLHEAGVSVTVVTEPHPDRKLEDFPFTVQEIEGLSDAHLDVIRGTSGLHTLISSLKPDVIHPHGYFAMIATSLSNPTDIPVVLSVHSTPVWGERLVGGMDSFEAELSFASQIIRNLHPAVMTAANDVYAEAALKVAAGHAPVVVFPYPIDIDFFQNSDRSLRRTFGLSDSDILVTTPSRIIPRKGIREVLFAMTELPENYHLCLPGAVEPLDPSFWKELMETAAIQKIMHRVIIPKQRYTYDQMPLLYAATDVTAMPSYYEGAPVATVEAMSTGKPFVGADSQGINGFIRNRENGLLVPMRDHSALASAITEVATNAPLAQKLATQARKYIERLSWDAQLPKLLELYNSVLAKKTAESTVEA